MPVKEMTIKEAIDAVRCRFKTLRGAAHFGDLEPIIRVGRVRLSNFERGAILKYDDMEKIEEWCDSQERTYGKS